MVQDASKFLTAGLLLHVGEVGRGTGVDDVVSDYDGTGFDEIALLEEVEVLQVFGFLLVHEDQVEGTDFVEEGVRLVHVLTDHDHVLHAGVGEDLLGYFSYSFVYLESDDLALRLQDALTQRKGRVSAVRSDLQDSFDLVLSDYLLNDSPLLGADVHHPALVAVLVDEIQRFCRAVLGAVLLEVVEQ
jgi:hypothetical protein